MQTIYAGILLAVTLFYTAVTVGNVPLEEPAYYDETVTVYLETEDGIRELPLQEYLTDVVLQEMPASFEEEALKAQCVAARTFTMRCMTEGGKHEAADVCGDPGCCQCYLEESEGIAIYGDGYDAAREKVLLAVQATDGQVLTAENALIEAAYFSSTGGSTESAASVWGGEVSYLQPVSSPEAPRITERSCSLEEFRSLLPDSELSGHPAGWFGEIRHTEGGSVEQMVIGGVAYSGTELRRIFSLKSARFTVSLTETSVEFEVVGSGHGVGMSQYGANEMAKQGSTYREILMHYYTGAELKELY